MMFKQIHGIYRGEREQMQGEGALLIVHPTEPDKYLAQFDNVENVYLRAHHYCWGWHSFDCKDFSDIYVVGNDLTPIGEK